MRLLFSLFLCLVSSREIRGEDESKDPKTTYRATVVGKFQVGVEEGSIVFYDKLPRATTGDRTPQHGTFIMVPIVLRNAGERSESIPKFALIFEGVQFDPESQLNFHGEVHKLIYGAFETIEPEAAKLKAVIFDAPKTERFELLISKESILSREAGKITIDLPRYRREREAGRIAEEKKLEGRLAKAREEARHFEAEEAAVARKKAEEEREGQFRKWTSGKYSVEARFVSYANGKVTLIKRDGKKITVDTKILSQPDQQFIQRKLDVLRKR